MSSRRGLMENWDRNLGLVLLLLGVGILAYGMFVNDWMDDTHPYTDLDTVRVYVGVISAFGIILVILGALEVVHGLPKKPGKETSPIETDE